jgi:hypothetical protein
MIAVAVVSDSGGPAGGSFAVCVSPWLYAHRNDTACNVAAQMSLFGKSAEKIEREQVGRAEFERLSALAAPELGVELMGAFGPDGPHGRGPNGSINILQLQSWFNKTRFPSGISYIRELGEPVREGVQALENAGLVLTTKHGQGQLMAATRLGQSALADGTVAAHMRGEPAP